MALGTGLFAEDQSTFGDVSWAIHQVCLITTCLYQSLLRTHGPLVKLCFVLGVSNVDVGDPRLCHSSGNDNNHDYNNNNKTRAGSEWLSPAAWHAAATMEEILQE